MWNQIIKLFGLIVILSFSTTILGQVNSPFSRYGVGIRNTDIFTSQRAMGSIFTAYANPKSINNANPASYRSFYYEPKIKIVRIKKRDSFYIDSATMNQVRIKVKDTFYFDTTYSEDIIRATSLETGVSLRTSNARILNDQAKSTDFNFDYLAIGLPIPKFGGMSFGLMPYSTVQYDLFEEEKLDSLQTIQYKYQGDGGLNQVYFGAAYGLGRLSIGLNGRYIFGRIRNSTVTHILNLPSGLGTRRQSSTNVSGITWDAGIQYSQPLGSNIKLNLGGVGHLSSSLNAITDTIWDRVFVENNGIASVGDTLAFVQNVKTKLEIPVGYGFGFGFEKPGKWLLSADYATERWQNLNNDSSVIYDNSWRASIGGFYIPNPGSNKFFEIINYRFGFYYKKINLVFNEQVGDYGMTFGFGIPILRSENRNKFYYSMLDLSFEIGKRGSIQQNSLTENYFKFTVGFNLNDNNWLRKTKYR
jgi:hypothetical protein